MSAFFRKLTLALMLLCGSWSAFAQGIDSLYHAFSEADKARAYIIANQIYGNFGDSAKFDDQSDYNAMKGMLLRRIIYEHYDQAEFIEAIAYAHEAIEFFKQREDWLDVAGCYNLLGNAYQLTGQLTQSIDCYDQCRIIMNQLNESGNDSLYLKNIRYTTNNMASIYLSMGEFDIAETMFRDCINQLGKPQNAKDYLDYATYIKNIGDTYYDKSKGMEGEERIEMLNKALELVETALDLSIEHNEMEQKVILRMKTLSGIYFDLGREDDAFAMADSAFVIAERIGETKVQAELHVLYGDYYNALGDRHLAEAHYLKAIELSEQGHYNETLQTAYEGAYLTTKPFDKARALNYYEKSVALKDSIFNMQQQLLIRDYQVKYNISEKEHQLELQQEKTHRAKSIIILLFVLAVLLLALFVLSIHMLYLRKQQNKSMERLGKAKDHLFSVASHDIKTSVLSENLMLELLSEHFDEMSRPELKQRILALKQSSDSIKEKTFNLIQWMLVELDHRESLQEPFDVRLLAEDCIKASSTECDRKSITVDCDVPFNLTGYDDTNIIHLVLRNLISNAVKFSWPDSRVYVDAEEEDDFIWLTVEDHGKGMSNAKIESVKENAVTPTQGTRGEQGTGIGLMLCHQLMERNGGKMEISSVVDKGTKVRFTIKKQKNNGKHD